VSTGNLPAESTVLGKFIDDPGRSLMGANQEACMNPLNFAFSFAEWRSQGYTTHCQSQNDVAQFGVLSGRAHLAALQVLSSHIVSFQPTNRLHPTQRNSLCVMFLVSFVAWTFCVFTLHTLFFFLLLTNLVDLVCVALLHQYSRFIKGLQLGCLGWLSCKPQPSS
jgi:hypothetical protein